MWNGLRYPMTGTVLVPVPVVIWRQVVRHDNEPQLRGCHDRLGYWRDPCFRGAAPVKLDLGRSPIELPLSVLSFGVRFAFPPVQAAVGAGRASQEHVAPHFPR